MLVTVVMATAPIALHKFGQMKDNLSVVVKRSDVAKLE